MRWRGGEGEKGRGVPAEEAEGRGVRAVQQRARLLQSKLNPPTQLLRYSYLEELKLKITAMSKTESQVVSSSLQLPVHSPTLSFIRMNE
jgi:hypothetical protein